MPNSKYVLVIPGSPQGKPVARIGMSKGGKPMMFAGKRQGEYKARIQAAWAQELAHRFERDWKPWEGPVFVWLRAFSLIPKSWPKRRRGEKWDCRKPDADNLVKAVGDALTGLAWVDDKQVQIGQAVKLLTTGEERLEVDIEFVEV